MGAAAVVTSVLAQLQEFFDIQVPRLQVRADRALALAALVHGHGRVVHHLQERHDTLALAVRALDVRAECAHRSPVVAQAAGELAQQRVFLQGFVDTVKVVGHGRQIAARQLRAARATVEKCRRGAHEVEGRQDFVKLDGARFAVDLVQRQAHGYAHEESLRHFNALVADMQEVPVEQGLQAEIVELHVALGLERGAQAGQIILLELLVQQLGLHALLDIAGEIFGVALRHLTLCHFFAEDFAADRVHQKASRGARVARILFDQGARSQDGGLVDLINRHAVVEIALGLGVNRIGLHIGAEVLAARGDQRLQGAAVQGHALALVDHRKLAECRRVGRGLA